MKKIFIFVKFLIRWAYRAPCWDDHPNRLDTLSKVSLSGMLIYHEIFYIKNRVLVSTKVPERIQQCLLCLLYR